MNSCSSTLTKTLGKPLTLFLRTFSSSFPLSFSLYLYLFLYLYLSLPLSLYLVAFLLVLNTDSKSLIAIHSVHVSPDVRKTHFKLGIFIRGLADGGIGICEMLFCTSLVALVGAGEQPAFSPRRLQIMNTKVSL